MFSNTTDIIEPLAVYPIRFSKWSGPDGLEQFIIQQTGCKPYSGAGICPRIQQQTTILRSVDNTYYYDDNLSNPHEVQYTLFGHNGDQSEYEPKFNAPLLDINKTKHIYLYRVRPNGRAKEYLWYGQYNIVGSTKKPHPGKDGIMRDIILLHLKRPPGRTLVAIQELGTSVGIDSFSG